jgi:lysophospholipase L1-like esterase
MLAMPTRERHPRTWSSRLGLRAAGVSAMLIALVVVAVLNAFARSGGTSAVGSVGQRTHTSGPGVARVAASGGISRSVMVVGIGDSVTSGSNCNCESFVGLYATSLASQRGLTTSSVNLGVAGWTSPQLLQNLTQPGTFRDQVSKADILLVTIGANDLLPLESKQTAGCGTTCYGPLVDSVAHNVELIVAAARAAHPSHPPTILVTDYWNVFQDGDVGTAENGGAFQNWSDTLTRAASNAVCTAARQAGATCVSLYGPFKGNGSKNPTTLLAADGDHPNSAGHQLIASTLLADTPAPIP